MLTDAGLRAMKPKKKLTGLPTVTVCTSPSSPQELSSSVLIIG